MLQVDWGAIGAWTAVVSFIGGLGYALWRIGRWFGLLEARLKTIKTNLGDLNKAQEYTQHAIGALLFIHHKELYDLYRGVAPSPPGNPYTVQERDQLLEKLRLGSISYQEAQRLTQILEEERAAAQAQGAWLAVMAIGGLLLLLMVIIAASRK